ncbi:MAG: hypothetical protein HY078_13950 [Elusimicrobia bacterium]|nr:hypothetical protein [Elusimicrobiota bacterium]
MRLSTVTRAISLMLTFSMITNAVGAANVAVMSGMPAGLRFAGRPAASAHRFLGDRSGSAAPAEVAKGSDWTFSGVLAKGNSMLGRWSGTWRKAYESLTAGAPRPVEALPAPWKNESAPSAPARVRRPETAPSSRPEAGDSLSLIIPLAQALLGAQRDDAASGWNARDRVQHSPLANLELRSAANSTPVIRPQDMTRPQRSSDPLVFDLTGDGIRTSDLRVVFDLTGEGKMFRVHDVASNVGVLAFDADGDGVSGGNGSELFGDRTDLNAWGRPDGFSDGFQALEEFIFKAEREGVLPRGIARRGRLGPKELRALEKAYGLKMRVGSFLQEAVSLRTAGVREIVLSNAASEFQPNFDGQNDDALTRAGAHFVRADGSRGEYCDVFFRGVETRMTLVASTFRRP